MCNALSFANQISRIFLVLESISSNTTLPTVRLGDGTCPIFFSSLFPSLAQAQKSVLNDALVESGDAS
jgi:hypothetical protein